MNVSVHFEVHFRGSVILGTVELTSVPLTAIWQVDVDELPKEGGQGPLYSLGTL